MNNLKTGIGLTLAWAALVLGFALWKSGVLHRPQPSPEIARIGYFRLSAADWADRMDSALPGRAREKTGLAGKNDLLWQIIREELLLQEAQRAGLDKDPEFVRGVEKYWRQALIGQVLRRFDREVEPRIQVDDREIEQYYRQMRQQLRFRVWTFENRTMAERFRSMLASGPADGPVRGLLADAGVRTENYEDVDPGVRGALADLEPGTSSLVDSDADAVLLVRLEARLPRELPPLGDLWGTIKDLIHEEKYQAQLHFWVDALRRGARIHIFRDRLAALPG